MHSIKINGGLEEFFRGKFGFEARGSSTFPYLLFLAMEVFTRMMNGLASVPTFKFHPKAKKINLNHLISANDVFMLCLGDPKAKIINLNHVIFADYVLMLCHGDLGSMRHLISCVTECSIACSPLCFGDYRVSMGGTSYNFSGVTSDYLEAL